MKTRIYGYREKVFDGIMSFGAENTSVIDRLCAYLLALYPILQHYMGIYKNAAFTIVLLMSPYMLHKLFEKILSGRVNYTCLKAVIPLLLFQVYKAIDHGIDGGKLALMVVMVVFSLAFACGCVNLKHFLRAAAVVCIAAGIGLIIQYAAYYGAGLHIQMVPTGLLAPESSDWILGCKTGLYGVKNIPNAFYRPSAFFLEPSHLFLYSFPVLGVLLLSPDINKTRLRAAALVTTGMILCTSGMGIVIAVGLWMVYFAFYYKYSGMSTYAKLQHLFCARNVLIMFMMIGALIAAYFYVPFINNIISRVFESGNSNAISGRTMRAGMLIDQMQGSQFLVGVTEDVEDITFNLPGFFSTLYKYGIFGLIFSYTYYVSGIFRLKGPYFWISMVITAISLFTAHTHGTFYMLYYVLFITNGYYCLSEEPGFKEKAKDKVLLSMKL